MRNGIIHFFARVEEIKDSTLDCTASPASKERRVTPLLPESCQQLEFLAATRYRGTICQLLQEAAG